jgi:hypothetical protein
VLGDLLDHRRLDRFACEVGAQLPDQLGAGYAEHDFRLPIALQDPPLEIGHEDRHPDPVEELDGGHGQRAVRSPVRHQPSGPDDPVSVNTR